MLNRAAAPAENAGTRFSPDRTEVEVHLVQAVPAMVWSQHVITSLSEELEDLIASLNRAADGLADVTGPEIRDDISSAVSQADSLMGRLSATSVRFDRAAASLETILGRMERGEGTLGQLSVNDSLYVSLNAAVASVRLLADDMRANPGRYINLSIF